MGIDDKVRDRTDAILDRLSREQQQVEQEALQQLNKGKSWMREHWYIPVIVLGFVVVCSLIWAVTR
jgi:hypothetical protein